MTRRSKVAVPSYRVVAGDCRNDMQSQLGNGVVDLLVADPPYNIGVPYDNYDDNQPWQDYLQFTRDWLTAATQVLHRHGSLWLFLPDESASDIDVMCRHELGLHRRSWIVWYYTFGVASQKNFARSHTHIFYYTKTKTKFTFNPEAIRVPSARQAIYNDKRQKKGGKLPDNTWVLMRSELEPLFEDDRDTWLNHRVCGTFHERKAHSPNQLPLALVERIVLSCSTPNQLVVDPFLGTGTTGVAAVKYGRRFWGMDCSSVCVDQATTRIQQMVSTLEPPR